MVDDRAKNTHVDVVSEVVPLSSDERRAPLRLAADVPLEVSRIGSDTIFELSTEWVRALDL